MWRSSLFALCVNVLCVSVIKSQQTDEMTSYFRTFHIVPDIISTVPRMLLEVDYPGYNVSLGNILKPSVAIHPPKITWVAANPNSYYTLMMVDPDYPSPDRPSESAFLNWLVVNVEGDNTAVGEIIAEYVGPIPKAETRFHRYVILIFKQTTKCIFDEKYISNKNGEKRKKFSVSKFTEEYELGKPIAGNFYRAEYDPIVTRYEKQLKLL